MVMDNGDMTFMHKWWRYFRVQDSLISVSMFLTTAGIRRDWHYFTCKIIHGHLITQYFTQNEKTEKYCADKGTKMKEQDQINKEEIGKLLEKEFDV